MAITFDNELSPYYIFRYKAATSTYSANLATLSVFDYFDDNLAAGDILYIGLAHSISGTGGSHPFHNIKFYVGTPLVADAITLIWEYHSGSSWVEIPDVVDNTVNFSVTGENWVTFPIPPNWWGGVGNNFHLIPGGPINVNNTYAIYVRCRVVSVTNPTEGGAQSTQTVKVKDYTIDVNNESAATLTSIYNADVAGGWGVLTKDGSDFVLNANLKFTGTTSFTSKQEYLRVGTPTYPWSIWSPSSNASTQFGEKDSSGYGINGSFIYYNTKSVSNGNAAAWYNLKMYGTKMWMTNVGFGNFVPAGVCEFIDCIFDTWYLYMGQLISAGSVIRRCMLDFTYYWYLYTGNLEIDKVFLAKACSGILSGVGANNTINNVEFASTQQLHRYYACNVTLTNCTGLLNENIKSYSPSGTSDLWVKKRFTIDLKIQDVDGNPISGATVKCVDGQGTTVVDTTTDANGNIAQQTLTVYQKLWEYPSWSVVETDYNPFTFTISKSGYQTKIIKYTMDRKREEIEVLEKVLDYNLSRKARVLSQ